METIVLTEDFPWTPNPKKYNITKTKKEILNSTLKEVVYYTINSNDFKSISYSFGNVNYITLIDSKNVNEYAHKELLNVFLFIDNEMKLFENFLKLYNNINGWISIKLKPLTEYNQKILFDQLSQLSMFNNELRKISRYICINEFEDFVYDKNQIFINDKFDCIFNPYYYEPVVIRNILQQKINNVQTTFNKEFLEKQVLFLPLQIKESGNDLLKEELMLKNKNLFTRVFLLEQRLKLLEEKNGMLFSQKK